MSMRTEQAEALVQSQRDEWDAAAEGWKKWWPWMEAGSRSLDQDLLTLVGVKPGDAVLDIATGLGEPALTAAALVGDSGRVVGVDIAPQMLAIARERAELLERRNVDYRSADARTLPFPDRSFDTVVCRSGLMLIPEPERVISEARRVLRPGGRMLSAVPASPPETPMIGVAFGVIAKALDLAPAPSGTPNFYALSKPGSVEALYEAAGLRDVSTERLVWETSYESAGRYVEFLRDVAVQVVRLVASQSPPIQQSIWQSIEAAAASTAEKDGTVRFENVFICVVGER